MSGLFNHQLLRSRGSNTFYNIMTLYKEMLKEWGESQNKIFCIHDYPALESYNLQCVTGDCPLAINPSHNWITFGTPMILLE